MSFKVPQLTSLQPNNTSATWTRPGDWITITDAAGECQFLVNDIGSATFTLRTDYTKPAAQNFYIDWGDGVTTTISATGQTDTAHTYTIGSGTACTLGYTTFEIRVYVDAGATISQCQFIQSTVNGVTQLPFAATGLLEAYFGDGIGITNYNQYFYTVLLATSFSGAGFFWLKYVKLPANSDNVTSMGETFYQCVALARVTMPTSMSTISQSNAMFYNCRVLESITFPSNATGMTSFSNMFNLCYNLTSVTFPTTLNSVTAADNAFTSCRKLNNITLPSMTSCTNYSNAFSFCFGLKNVKFTSWTATGVAITLTTMFNQCFSLTSFIWPTTAAIGTTFLGGLTSMFEACFSIQSVFFPEYLADTAVPNLHSGIFGFNDARALTTIVYPSSVNALVRPWSIGQCPNIVSITMPLTMNSLGNVTQFSFTGCYRLTSIAIPSTTSPAFIGYSFSSCYSLNNVTIPASFSNVTSMSNMFNNCYSLESITLPAIMNSCTSFSGTFTNCVSLKSVTMPTSMTAATSIGSMFNNCHNLTSVVFPATMNAVTFAGSVFTACYNLSSVTLPTSMTGATTFSAIFNGCNSLQSITFPATIGAAVLTDFNGAMNQCASLVSVTLPTTQSTSLNASSMQFLFGQSPNLTTVTNMDKLGPTSTTVGTVISATNFAVYTPQLTSTVDLYPRLTQLQVQGTATYRSKISNVRLRNTGASQWTGTSPQINVSYTDMSTAQLNTLFADMAAQPVVVSKTIDITSATGAAGLTAADRLVITSRGWTITG